MDPPPPYAGPEKGMYPPPGPGYPPAGVPPPGPGYPPAGPPPVVTNPPPVSAPGYGQPMQPGYGPPMQAAPGANTTTTIITQPAVVAAVPIVFHEYPVSMICPSCRAQIVTSVMYETGTFAWLLFFLMCVFGFWICCFIPFCIDACKDAVHSCPNCHAHVGVFRRM